MSKYTHFDTDGSPTLVDISKKNITSRTAVAEGWIRLPTSIYETVSSGNVKKGNPLSIAELAGIMGAKQTASLIPLCHTVGLENVSVKCNLDRDKKALHIICEVTANYSTGVEMEALTAVSVAALCFYDMCKAVDKGMMITDIRLLKKSGGSSGEWTAEKEYKK